MDGLRSGAIAPPKRTVRQAAGHRVRRGLNRSLGWALFEGFGLSGLSLFSLVIFAWTLTPYEIGIGAVALSVVQMLTMFVEMLFHDALVQRRRVEQIHYDTAFSFCFGMGCVFSALCWIGAPLLGRAMGDPVAGEVLAWMSLSMPFMGLSSSLMARMRREMEFRALALRAVLGRAGAFVIATTLALAGAGVWALVAQQVLLVALATLALWALSRSRPHFRFGRQAFRDLWSFGLRATAGLSVEFVTGRVFMVQVGMLLGAEAAGFFSLAQRVVEMLRALIAGAVTQLALPVLARLQDTPRLLRPVFRSSTELTAAATFPVFLGLVAVAPEAVAVVFGPQWLPAVPAVMALALMTLIVFARVYSGPTMSATGRPELQLAVKLAELPSLLILPLVAAPTLAIAVGAWVLRALLALPVDVAMLRRASGLSPRAQFRGLGLLLLLSGAMAGGVMLVSRVLPASMPHGLRLALLVATGAILYALLLRVARPDLMRRLVALLTGRGQVPAGRKEERLG